MNARTDGIEKLLRHYFARRNRGAWYRGAVRALVAELRREREVSQ